MIHYALNIKIFHVCIQEIPDIFVHLALKNLLENDKSNWIITNSPYQPGEGPDSSLTRPDRNIATKNLEVIKILEYLQIWSPKKYSNQIV